MVIFAPMAQTRTDPTPVDLKTFLEPMSQAERENFAKRCGSTAGHLRNVSYGYRSCAESLAISIERESQRLVRCESLRPDVDWQFLRNTA
jgi:DNA-binding transcriptional regulator YdaS (Cro superfamily)